MPLKRPFDAYDSSVSSTPPPQKRIHLSSPFPSSPYPPTTPSDSPTNPFGRKHTISLARNPTLPRPTSFGKHLALRFQVLGSTEEDVWRIAQVPLNYTFRHLHKLILFLFDGISDQEKRLATTEGKKTGHLFEVQKDVVLDTAFFKPGCIRSGRTWARLSSVLDPYRYREDSDEESDTQSATGDDDEEDGTEWQWEAEEDFTLSHAWPKGGDLKRAIVYHHDASATSPLSIHITINRKKVPPRKGIGNKPHVFLARGVISRYKLRSATARRMADGELNVDKWNAHDAFERFLKRFHVSLDKDEFSAPPSSPTPGARTIRSAPVSGDEDDGDDNLLMSSLSEPAFSDPFTPITPFPTRPLHRKRVEHASRRIVRLTRRGLAEVFDDEDDDEGDDDEGSHDGDEGDAEECSEGEVGDASGTHWEWDPFGDEAELCR